MNCSIQPERHRRALTAIGHALTLQNQPGAWCGLETVLRAHLTSFERACLLTSVAVATDTELLVEVLEAIVPVRFAGAPSPVFSEVCEDARWWADLATLPELRAWVAACFNRLPATEQAAFVDAASQRAAA